MSNNIFISEITKTNNNDIKIAYNKLIERFNEEISNIKDVVEKHQLQNNIIKDV